MILLWQLWSFWKKEQLQPGDENWPLITGVNADADAVKSVAEEKIGFTVMLDRRDLAEALTKLVETYLNGDDVDINNYSQYDNGVKIIGTVTCDGKLIDKDNYQILVDNGFYLDRNDRAGSLSYACSRGSKSDTGSDSDAGGESYTGRW